MLIDPTCKWTPTYSEFEESFENSEFFIKALPIKLLTVIPEVEGITELAIPMS